MSPAEILPVCVYTEGNESSIPPVVPDAHLAAAELSDRPQAFLNALLTEHFVHESARGITVSESSSRASLYLTTLPSSLVAFGFLSHIHFAMVFLGTVIPVVFLLGSWPAADVAKFRAWISAGSPQ